MRIFKLNKETAEDIYLHWCDEVDPGYFIPPIKKGMKIEKNIFSSINQLKYNDPQTIVNFIKQNVTDKVVLKDNYLNDDFTIFLYKS
jgi:hypothetical protein